MRQLRESPNLRIGYPLFFPPTTRVDSLYLSGVCYFFCILPVFTFVFFYALSPLDYKMYKGSVFVFLNTTQKVLKHMNKKPPIIIY